jgi:hypothetical protein
MIENIKKFGPKALISGVIYASGLVLGGILADFLFSIVTLEKFAHLEDAVRLIIGLLVAFFITGLSGAVSGFLGGYSLPLIYQSKGRWGNAWRSAISIGIPYGLSLYPIILVFSIIAFFTEEAPVSTISIGVMLVGAIFGLLASLLMGFMAIGKRGYASLVWAGALGFGIGGAVLGSGLWAFVNSINANGVNSGQWIWAAAGLFGFGLLGGTAWGYVFARLMEPERLPVRPGVSWKRYVVVSVILILLVIFLRPVFAAVGDLLTPQSADLATVLDRESK